MEQQPKLNGKSELKQNLIKYYDIVKSEIDIRAQEYLINKKLDEATVKHILEINLNLIEKCDQILDKTLKQTNDYFNLNSNEFDQDENDYIDQSCIFIRNDQLNKHFPKLPIGLLILFEWYLSPSLECFIRYFISFSFYYPVRRFV
jgi:hypothetical protein